MSISVVMHWDQVCSSYRAQTKVLLTDGWMPRHLINIVYSSLQMDWDAHRAERHRSSFTPISIVLSGSKPVGVKTGLTECAGKWGGRRGRQRLTCSLRDKQFISFVPQSIYDKYKVALSSTGSCNIQIVSEFHLSLWVIDDQQLEWKGMVNIEVNATNCLWWFISGSEGTPSEFSEVHLKGLLRKPEINFSSILECTGTIKAMSSTRIGLSSIFYRHYKGPLRKQQINLSSILECAGTIKAMSSTRIGLSSIFYRHYKGPLRKQQINFSSILECAGTIKAMSSTRIGLSSILYRHYKGPLRKPQIGFSSILLCTGIIKGYFVKIHIGFSSILVYRD